MSKDKHDTFMFGKTVSAKSFTNREKEFKKLKNNLLTGVNTILISPRRWGKSSLVEKVVADIRENESKVRVVQLDFFSIHSEEEFLQALAREVIKASSSKWEEWMRLAGKFFKQLVPKLSVGLDPQTDFSLSFDWEELIKHKDEVLNLPQTLAGEKGIQLIVCLDEFQNLSAFPRFEQLEKSMRASWQRHNLVTYCLFGSKRRMMTDIFNNSSKPFYRFGDIMLLGKIEQESWVPFIEKGFKKTGKSIEHGAAIRIAELMDCHSWYVQQLAHYTWTRTAAVATKKEVAEALEEVIQANLPLYQREVEDFSATQFQLLKAISDGEKQLTGQAAMKKYAIGTPRNILKNKQILLERDIIDEVNGNYLFLDPAFEIWFKRVFKRTY